MQRICIFLSAMSVLLAATSLMASEHWPQASGPHGTWKVDGTAPTTWSVVRDEHIRWRTPLPEAGMSAVTVWGDRVFTTIHQPITSDADQAAVQHVIGYCLDAHDGSVLWTVELPGSFTTHLGSGFTDGTVYPPVTDGEHVWFFNRLGSMGCYRMDGTQVWLRERSLRTRHANRMHKPTLIGDWIMHVEVADEQAAAALVDKSAYKGVPRDRRDLWTFIHAIDKRTGETVWREDVGTGIHNTPLYLTLPNGRQVVVHSRGGAHGPPEGPSGVSLTYTDGDAPGTTAWSTQLGKMSTMQNNHVHQRGALIFAEGQHMVLNTDTGAIEQRHALTEAHSKWSYDQATKKWQHETNAAMNIGKKGISYQTNILVGDWHYFRCHGAYYLGRVHVPTGRTEFLELPAQIVASSESREADQWLWNPKNPGNQPKNAGGFTLVSKYGMAKTGWGHVSSASPICVGNYIYIPTVTGTVYVIDTTVEELSPTSLVAINDMGRSQDTWTLASMSAAHGRLYVHTALEVICVEAP